MKLIIATEEDIQSAISVLNFIAKMNSATSEESVKNNVKIIVPTPEQLELPLPEPAVEAPLPSRLPDVPSLAVDEDTDTAGVKWDATLHSETRAKCSDGTWRKRRTPKNVVVPSVESPPPVVVPPPPVNVPAPPVDNLHSLPVGVAPITTFRELMELVTVKMAARKLTSKDIETICKAHLIDSLQVCFDAVELIPSIQASIERIASAR